MFKSTAPLAPQTRIYISLGACTQMVWGKDRDPGHSSAARPLMQAHELVQLPVPNVSFKTSDSN